MELDLVAAQPCPEALRAGVELARMLPPIPSVKAIVLFGSGNFAEIFNSGSSDVDVNIFVDESIDSLSGASDLFTDIGPWSVPLHHIEDQLQARVEGVLTMPSGLEMDITISTNEFRVNDSTGAVVADRLELYLGQLLVMGTVLLGSVPESESLPSAGNYFCDPLHESLRARRLSVLAQHATDVAKGVSEVCSNGAHAADCYLRFAKLIEAYLAWVNLQIGLPPISYRKHVAFQFKRLERAGHGDLLPVCEPFRIDSFASQVIDIIERGA